MLGRRQLLSAALAAFAALPLAAQVEAQDAASLLRRPVVVGASASAGFGLSVDLSDALDALIVAPHEEIVSFADAMFFTAPDAAAATQIRRALAHEPSLVFAIDFLFWFGYGNVPSEDTRLLRFERGLKNLERFDVPILVSRLPNMREAAGKMLQHSQVPQPETLDKLNEMLATWAKGRSNVYFVPLPELLGKLRSGAAFHFDGRSWPPEGTKLLQWDDLHPTIEGLALLANQALIHLAEQAPSTAAEFQVDPQRASEELREKIAAERAARKARSK